MKILLVDDEREEREGIEWLIHKYELPLEVAQANNGKTALEYIEKNPIDILFTDVKMPIMTGLELAKKVYARWPEIKIIIYSAYGEFEFARAAMEANAIRYLLKPIDLDQFKSLMEAVIDSVNKEQKDREEKDFHRMESEKNLLFKIFSTGSGSDREIKDISNLLFHDANFSGRLLYIQFTDNFFDKYEEKFCEMLKKYFSGNTEYLNMYPNEAYLVVGEEKERELKNKGDKILKQLENRFDSNGVILVSDGFSSSEQMLEGLHQIHRIQKDLFSYDNQTILIKDYLGNKSYYESDAEKICKKLRVAIEGHEEEFIRKYNDQLVESIKSMERVSKLYLQNMLYSIVKTMYDYYPGIESKELLVSAEALFSTGNSKELLRIYKDAMDKIFLLVQRDGIDETRVIAKIKNLVGKEYSKDISLNDMAEEVNLTPSYVSYIFKKETGQSLVKYITDVRMSKAKKLLEESDLKVLQIAKRCGYENQSYFNRLFKNYYGTTPKQLREKL